MVEWNEKDERGVDWDLEACLENNPQEGFTVDDIKKVLAVFEGENDDKDWRWVLELNSGKFVFLQGGCDYTGWDCQSSADHAFADTSELAAAHALDEKFVDSDWTNSHNEAHLTLQAQLLLGKDKTWREKMDDTDLGGYPKIDA